MRTAVDVPWKRRRDLSVVRHDSGGWVVKDPVSLNYALLDDVEFTILQALDGRTSMARIVDSLVRKFPGRQISIDDVRQFLQSLAGHQLIRPRFAVSRLRPNQSKPSIVGRAFRAGSQVLRIQIPLLNPRPLLDRVLPSFRRLVTPAAIGLAAIVCLVATVIVLIRFGELRSAFPEMQQFLGPGNLTTLLLIFVSVKCLHELAHALVARHYGAECNECGIMLLVFTPVLYTNVSDSWTLPRYQRMCVTAAGIAVELTIAALCVVLWAQASDPGVRSVLLNTMLLCSVNTLLFNGNPLLRFDGYFLLSDAIGIPNLASRSSHVIRSYFVSLFTGAAQVKLEEQRVYRVLLVYGMAAMIYRLLLTMAIIFLVNDLAEAWNVSFLGTIMTWVLLLGSLILPFGSFLFAVAIGDDSGSKSSGSRLRATLILAGVAALCLIPLPASIVAPALIEPSGDPVHAALAGRLEALAGYGDDVDEDQVLARLTNPDLLLTLQRYRSRVSELTTQLQVIERDPRRETKSLLPTLRASLKSAEDQLAVFQKELDSLQMTSSVTGQFFAPPDRSYEYSSAGESWAARPISTENKGAWIERGMLLGYVGRPQDFEIKVCLVDADAARVVIGQRVSVFLSGSGGVLLDGQVSQVGREPVSMLEQEFAASGQVAGLRMPNGEFRPAETSYYVTVQVESPRVCPAFYRVGWARIHVQPQSLVSRFVRFIRTTF